MVVRVADTRHEMSEGRILIVDNEPQIRRVLRSTLVASGFEVDDARSGDEALDQMRLGKYDLVLLDVNMPGLSGFETCRSIRAVSDVAIIMLTVRDTEKDKVQALDGGADDYLIKPFTVPELLARIRAHMRRRGFTSQPPNTILRLGDIEIDFEERQVRCGAGKVHLTSKEFDLLSYLAAHAGQAVTHKQLLNACWGPEYGNEQEYLRVFISRLRKKLELNPSEPQYLLTEPWVGYRLQLPH